MGKDTLIIGSEDHSFSPNIPRHDERIIDAEYSYEEVKEMILERPWLGPFLEEYINSGYEELSEREFYAKIDSEDKYLIRFPIIIKFQHERGSLDHPPQYVTGEYDWNEDDSDYEEDDASELTEVDNITERLQLFALRILKPIKVTTSSTSEEVEITSENFTTFSYDILRDFEKQYGLLNCSHDYIKTYFEQRDTILGYLNSDLSDIFPKKTITELPEQKLMNGIFYIQMKQLESFKESYGEDGRWYDTIRIHYDD
jgi:hypothetical protein